MGNRGRCTVAGQGGATALLLLALLLASGISLAAEGKQLSDSEAKTVIEQGWSSGGFRVYLGDFQVVDARPDLSKRRMAISEFKSYESWQDLGLIRITVNKELSKNFTGWDDWNRLFGEGVQMDAQIQATKEGAHMQVDQSGRGPSYLLIPSGTTTVEKIVRNEPIKIGVDDYRVVMGLHTTNHTQEAKYYLRKINAPSAAEGKFQVLLKFDPFGSTWKILVKDIADRDKEFRTNNVNAFVKSQQ